MGDVDLAEIKHHTALLGVAPQLHFNETPTDHFELEDEVKVQVLNHSDEYSWLEAAYQIVVATWTSKPLPASTTDMVKAVTIEREATIPLEAFVATIAISGVSRACTHQIVRHRKMGFGQESMRVTDLRHHPIRVPESIRRDPALSELFMQTMHQVKEAYATMVDRGIPLEEARAMMPMGTTTYIVVTGTLRAWIDYLRARRQDMAQREHRIIAEKVLSAFRDMRIVWPVVKDRLGL